jgi:hypothetical protein
MQKPPEIHARLEITGNVPGDTTWDMPLVAQVTQLLGVQPTEASYEQGLLLWEYALPKEQHWELPESVAKLVALFDADRVKRVIALGDNIYVQVSVACYMTDSYPAMNFSAELLQSIVSLGAHLDLDLYRTKGAEHNRDLL